MQGDPFEEKQIGLLRKVALRPLTDRDRLPEAALGFKQHREVAPTFALVRVQIEDRPQGRLRGRQVLALKQDMAEKDSRSQCPGMLGDGLFQKLPGRTQILAGHVPAAFCE